MDIFEKFKDFGWKRFLLYFKGVVQEGGVLGFKEVKVLLRGGLRFRI